ncbi:MobA-like protein [Catenovulum agarivorans DS-2]|uniref:MobA-like protein n=1 Tax=Catenovulum agarivorans DS-2 TaxID=1328313 RepID=W7QER4_9ALTE|nr:nucleotidyltransferase family protein [Catenovulum agarivorans]EWH10411.1 MobA-like protein [Catenovulum agarivorans DS-2]
MKIAAVIMAAGQSSRFKDCKHLAQIGESCLLRLVYKSLQQTNIDDIYIITGHWHQQISQYFAQHTNQHINILYNPNWQAGIGNSIAFAVSKLTDKYNAILITLADQVAITGAEYQQLLDTFTNQQADISCAQYNHTKGVPAIFRHTTFAELCKLAGDKGAKKLLNSRQFNSVTCTLDSAAIDIDTQQQLRQYLAHKMG